MDSNSPPISRPLSSDVEGLKLAECWQALASASLGRLAVLGSDGAPDIFPMNYVVHDEQIYLRSAPGAKLMAIVRDSRVAFEADAVVDGMVWSVVLRGRAERITDPAELARAEKLPLRPFLATVKTNFVRIAPGTISGRYFRFGH